MQTHIFESQACDLEIIANQDSLQLSVVATEETVCVTEIVSVRQPIKCPKTGQKGNCWATKECPNCWAAFCSRYEAFQVQLGLVQGLSTKIAGRSSQPPGQGRSGSTGSSLLIIHPNNKILTAWSLCLSARGSGLKLPKHTLHIAGFRPFFASLLLSWSLQPLPQKHQALLGAGA